MGNLNEAVSIVQRNVQGKIFECVEGLSFWGGVDPESGKIIDVYHPNHGDSLTGKLVLMPTMSQYLRKYRWLLYCKMFQLEVLVISLWKK